MGIHLLHGTIQVTIYGIDSLHIGCIGSCQQLGKRLISGVSKVICRPECMNVSGSQLYAAVDLDKARMAWTRIIKNHPSKPQWNQTFKIYCAHSVSNVIFTVKDDNPVGATLIGRAYIPAEDVVKGYIVNRWVEIKDVNGNPIPGESRIHVKLQYSSVTADENWSNGIRTPQYDGVPNVFFNQRYGCKVTLYQDAHVLDEFQPKILLDGGKFYKFNRCWEDMFDAIVNAKHLIYIAGWSVYTEIKLIRDPNRPKPEGDKITLGELLKMKADEGVTVLVLIWDDTTSIDFLKQNGLMATHDEETKNYFKGSNVHCVLCPRLTGDSKFITQSYGVTALFTHHQKTVVVDSEIPGELGLHKRTIVSFLGGIDLCGGRYDTQEHPLFKTLDSIHYDDFHQPNFNGASIKKGGPREPWHDIHCKLEGPIAWDVLYNFEQRWKKQVGNQFIFSYAKLYQVIVPPSLINLFDTDTWNVQLFRSIDRGSVVGFPKKHNEAANLGLVTRKYNIIDGSIQDAYINAIRRAKNYIYIENQYFLGSSYGWLSTDIEVPDIRALHLIPKELSLKIVSKIEAGERFTVYIVIPMWPEGKPDSGPIQSILDWQRRTIEMMYADIAVAIRKKGLNADPRDYLTFFCLGNKEKIKPGEYKPAESPEPDSDYYRAQQARRFMIYVHAKMMIVDDEYIIIGSANINQRSMDGARDTEIAMGAFQPHHLATTSPARGQIYGFRMALWYEHTGRLEPLFQNPEDAQCVRLLNNIAEENWNKFCDNSFVEDLPSHLLRYPIHVDNNGAITTLAGVETFPDTHARIFGSKSDYLPAVLTT